MSRRCMVTGTGVMVGHRVSHANNKSKRRFLPNLQAMSLLSDALGRRVHLRLTPRGVKTIERSGGLDAWLMKTASTRLDERAKRLRRQVERAMAKQPAV